MANNQQKFTINFDALLNIKQMTGALQAFQQNLNKLKVPSSLFASTTKDIVKLEGFLKDFQVLTGKTEFNHSEISEIIKLYSKIDNLVSKINLDTQNITGIDLNKLIPDGAQDRLQKLEQALIDIQDLIDFQNNKPSMLAQLGKDAQDAQAQLKVLKKELSTLKGQHTRTENQLIQNAVDLDAEKRTKTALTKREEELRKQPAGIDSKEYAKMSQKIAALEKRAKDLPNIIDTAKEKLARTSANTKEATTLRGAITQAESDLQAVTTELQNLKAAQTQLAQQPPGIQTAEYKQVQQDIADTIAKIKQLENEKKSLEASEKAGAAAITAKQQEIDAKLTQLQDLNNQITALNNANIDTAKLDSVRQVLATIANVDISKIPTDLKALKTFTENLTTTELEQFKKALNNLGISAKDLGLELDKLRPKMQGAIDEDARFQQQLQDVRMLKTRIQYFFGLTNTINLFKRAVRQAFNTIKELDKAMTETAVVTDFSVGDMWEQLPEYTKRANELGVTTLAAYEAATLYYQQGLKTNEVNALSVETLKMARIAGLEAAEATDRMTNALRGFNMALTEANAQRVDDVYSELAANTASNVDEISTAMTKVASLAHNANMEFETTAAFLSQIIETTRESAETAGTALKTVVARFSEVKKLVDEGTLRGQDEEGQAIDVNKVGSALRTAGIDLNKYFLGEVGLDDIFMELASKWDSLNSIQQRYIATQAAGSRQQSRFIALMQDYARTQELVGKAYNANGAAARQFAKTQESLESKLNRLKNAWNEFLMGITNSQIVKGFVDLLTDLLNVVNKLTSGFGDVTSSIMKMGTAFLAIKGAKKVFNSVGFDSILSLLTGTTTDANGKVVKINPIKILAEKAKDFKQANLNISGGVPKTLFGALGNKFAGTGIGKAISTKMGGMLLGSGAELGGAATLGIALGGVAVAATAAYGIVKTLYDLSPKGQLKTAEKFADTLNTVAANARQAESNLKQIQTDYSDKTIKVKTAITISDETKAIESRNEYITSLLEQDATYAKYISSTIDKSGRYILTLDEEKLAEAAELAAKAATQAAINAQLSQASVSAAKAQSIFSTNSIPAGTQLGALFQSTFGRNFKEANITSIEDLISYLDANAHSEQEWGLSAEARQEFEQLINEYKIAQSESVAKSTEGFKLALQDITDTDSADLIAVAYGQLFDAAKQQKQINNNAGYGEGIGNIFGGHGKNSQGKDTWNYWWTPQKARIRYEEIYGEGSAKDLKNHDVRLAMARYDATQQNEADLQELDRFLQGSRGELYKQVLEEFTGNADYNNLVGTNLEQPINDLIAQLEESGATNDELTQFATLLHTDLNGIKTESKKQRTRVQEFQLKTSSNLYQKMFESGVDLTPDLQKWINQKQPEWREAALSALTEAEKIGLDKFAFDIPELDLTQLNEFKDFFKSIDLNDPINALKTLNKEANNPAFGKYIGQIREANKELFTTSSLVQAFITSADYNSLTESLSNFVEENGKITGQNIKDLAEDCDKLNDLMELAKVNAYGLAKAFTLYETGAIGFENLTDGILKALSATISLSDAIDELSSFIADFDPGRDFGEGADFFHKQTEELQELVDSYEFGNERTQTIYDALFGEGAYKKFMDSNWEKGPEEVAKIISKRISDRDFLLRDNSYGFMNTRSSELGGGYGKITKTGEYDFEWDIGNRTTEQLIEGIQRDFESRGESISRAAAESIISGWAAQSWDFADALNTNDFNASVKVWAEELGDAPTIALESLEGFASAFGMEVEDVEKKIRDLRTEAGQPIPMVVSWKDEQGNPLTGDALHEQIRQVISEGDLSVREILGDTLDGQSIINADQALTNVKVAFSLNDAQAEEELDRFAKELQSSYTQDIEVPVKLTVNEDGTIDIEKEVRQVSGTTKKELQENIDLALSDANYKLIGESLANQNLNAYKSRIIEATREAGEEATGVLTGELSKVDPEIVLTVAWKWKDDKPPNVNDPNGTIIVDSQGSDAAGGIVRSFAKGTLNRWLQPGFALTGEEGPEIIWNKEQGYSYITGQNGPEYQNLQPGDRVFNAQETSRILRNSSFAKGGLYGSYGSGTGGYNPKKLTDNDSGGGGGGSGKSKEKDEEWKNEIDWLYNLVEDIAELERIQTQLQEQYDDYLIDQTKTGQDLYKLLIQQLGNLYTQLDHQTFALEKREQEMREFMDTTNQYDDYLWYNWDDRTIEIDWDAIEALQGSEKETYDKIVDLIDEAEEIQGKMDDAEDAIMDIQNQIQELEHIWRDTFTDFEERVYRAIVKEFQTVIDNYSRLNDTLNNSNQAILQAIQKEISLQREIRENTKTEEEIADNEAQLAYLRRDTSGGNETAALELEKQLADQRESYEDSLIDQAISRLQEDNDAAAQQREHQIEIMQAQLDYQEQNGEFNAMVLELLQGAMGADGELLTNSDLVDLLKTQENWAAMSEVSQQVWEEELNTTFKEVAAFLLKQNAEESGMFTQALTSAIEAVNASIGSYSQGITKFLNNSSGSGGSGGGGKKSGGDTGGGKCKHTWTNWKANGDGTVTQICTKCGAKRTIKSDDKPKVDQVALAQRSREEAIKKAIKYNQTHYATGGLNTRTGPAWLDGTPSEPEYVLNARQTEAFLKLADVLPEAMSNSSTSNITNSSNATFNIAVNVDKIDSDYDVDRLVDRVKEQIYNIGSYRNVNTLNFSR